VRNVAAILIAAVAALAAAPANANDSTAELTTGGLVLGRSADIEMRSEDLAISQREIAVRYRFFNRGAEDETVTVAFPVPDIAGTGPDFNVAVPDPDAANFLDFRTLVDGAEVKADYQQKALLKGVDLSERLRALGVPLAVQSGATYDALDRLPRPEQDRLLADGVAAPNEFDVGKGMERHLVPMWTFRSSFYWRQTFPAGRETTVEHRYRPSLGATTGTRLELTPLDLATLAEYEARYCVDRDFLSGLRGAQAKARAGEGQTFFENRIAYVLSTGANWAGPIEDFRLTVDKGAPDSLVSFCEQGVRKIGPTTFEVRHAHFTPTRDLDILILYRPRL
jgi:hypothetical protein